jgi:pyruvate formate lyase activating enzyme
MLGSEIALNDLMKTIDNEAIFFDQSGGGVTCSFGEPLLHAPYLLKVLKACGERYYHRVVDTTAFAKTAVLLEVAQHTELFLIDLKHMDDAIHKRFTGVGNEKILSNIVELAKEDCDITFRLPLIKDVNADFENISKTAQFINDLQGDRNRINLLPYHKAAETKYQKLGTKDKFVSFKAPDASEQQKIVDLFKEYGIEATIGG